jgi:hypothetical protein
MGADRVKGPILIAERGLRAAEDPRVSNFGLVGA